MRGSGNTGSQCSEVSGVEFGVSGGGCGGGGGRRRAGGGMAAGAGEGEFAGWLSGKLAALQTDEGVFGSYIAGILDGEDTLDDKRDALEGILAEVAECDIASHVTEILDKWTSCQPKESKTVRTGADVDIQLSKLLESQSLATTTRREYTEEEKKIREAILSQYSQLSDHEDNDEVAAEPEVGPDLVRNTNSLDVAAAARERREQARQDSQRKKEKDKEDREKQKQLKEDKKEKRKTQKGERKR